MDDIHTTHSRSHKKSGDKKARTEGRSHTIAHVEDSDQRARQPAKMPSRIKVRLWPHLTLTRTDQVRHFQKNHPPEKAAECLQSQSQ